MPCDNPAPGVRVLLAGPSDQHGAELVSLILNVANFSHMERSVQPVHMPGFRQGDGIAPDIIAKPGGILLPPVVMSLLHSADLFMIRPLEHYRNLLLAEEVNPQLAGLTEGGHQEHAVKQILYVISVAVVHIAIYVRLAIAGVAGPEMLIVKILHGRVFVRSRAHGGRSRPPP